MVPRELELVQSTFCSVGADTVTWHAGTKLQLRGRSANGKTSK